MSDVEAPSSTKVQSPLSRLWGLPISPWVVWFAIVIMGNLVLAHAKIDAEFLNASSIIPIIVAYPLFLIAIKRYWPQRKLLATGGMALYSVYLMEALALEQATLAGAPEADFVLLFIVAVSFGIPIFLARGQKPTSVRPKSTVGDIIVMTLLTITVIACYLGWYVYSAFVAAEVAQANAFRDFCKQRVEGAAIDQIRHLVPERFIHSRNETEFEISSHGRGCVVINRDGTLSILQLLPKRGFHWMVTGPPGARLQGTFEPGGIGERLLPK